MADFTQSLFRIDPTQGLVDYVQAVKPYHTKILDVLVEYVYTEKIDATVKDSWSWTMTFTRPDIGVEYSCGYGYRWDPSGLTAPEAEPTSRIVSALGKLLIDVSTTAGSSTVSIIRNPSGHLLTVDAPIVFQNIPIELYNPTLSVEFITPGKTYYVVSVAPSSFEISDMIGGTPITIGATATLQVLPQNLRYNTFLVEPTLNTSTYECLATNITANQISFTNSYNITGADTVQNKWHFAVGTWLPGSGYAANTTVSTTLIGGTGAGTQAQADITTDALGSIVDVVITDTGTKTYVAGDVLVTPSFPGFAFTVTIPALTLPLVADQPIYVNGNSISIANGKYTVVAVQGSAVQVAELIPPLTGATGTLHVIDAFEVVPYWPSGLKVRVNATGTPPGPLVNSGVYYFIPTSSIGTFNLAITRYPREFSDYVDLTSIGSSFTLQRAEPFTPGDIATVFGTQNNNNDGSYVVSTIEAEGSNFRIGVMQNIPRTTPNPSPLPYDGAMVLHMGAYDMPQICPPVRTPDLYANTFIDENLQFTFLITANDFIGTTVVENNTAGWGTSLFGSSTSVFGTGMNPLYPYTAMTDGISTTSGTHLVLPTGFDTQLFDVGAIDETLAVAATLPNLP